MRLQLCAQTCSETEASIARRARVLAYRLACGELVTVPPWDPVWGVEWSYRVRHGNAAGAVPSCL